MTASVPSGTDQSSRSSPPDAVSPDTPALTIVTASVLAFSAAANRDGNAASAGSPNPALSESPNTTIFTGRSAASAHAHASTHTNATSSAGRKALDPGRVPPI